jgi:hypothetical protein
MPEVIETVLIVKYRCDSCDEGFMYPTGNLYPPGLTEHQCMFCGDYKNFEKCYDVRI